MSRAAVIAVNRPVREPWEGPNVFTPPSRPPPCGPPPIHAILSPNEVGLPNAGPRKNPMTRPLLAILLAGSLFAIHAHAQGEIRPGPWQTASKVPEGWVIHNTKNYHVQCECGPEKAQRLGEHMEVMNAVYRRMFKPDKAGAKQQTIKLFKNNDTYLAYGGRFGVGPGAAAYYASSLREMVCYDTGKWMDEKKVTGPVTGTTPEKEKAARRRQSMEDMWKMDLLGCAAHEGWHQYYHWLVVSDVDLPSWINEGMGDYFYTAAPKDGKKKEASLGLVNDARIGIIRAARRQDRMEPLEKFLGMLQSDYYSNPSICYAQGWAFCQFLLHAEKGKYAKVIPNYIKGLCNDTNWQSVQTKAFRGIDIATMEAEFKAYIDTLKPGVPDPFEEEEEEGAGKPPAEPPAPPASGEPAPQPPAKDPPKDPPPGE